MRAAPVSTAVGGTAPTAAAAVTAAAAEITAATQWSLAKKGKKLTVLTISKQ